MPRNKENFAVRCLKGVGYWFLGSFMCFFMCTITVMIMRGALILKVFVGFCTAAITLGLLFNWSYYCAKRDRNAVKYHNMEYDRLMPLKMSLTAPIFSYVMLIVLYVSKLGLIPDILNYYMLANMWLLPFLKMFTEGTTLESVTWGGMAGFTFLVLLQPAIIAVTYILTYKDVDVAKEVLYKK